MVAAIWIVGQQPRIGLIGHQQQLGPLQKVGTSHCQAAACRPLPRPIAECALRLDLPAGSAAAPMAKQAAFIAWAIGAQDAASRASGRPGASHQGPCVSMMGLLVHAGSATIVDHMNNMLCMCLHLRKRPHNSPHPPAASAGTSRRLTGSSSSAVSPGTSSNGVQGATP
jgi:hypothetical protein